MSTRIWELSGQRKPVAGPPYRPSREGGNPVFEMLILTRKVRCLPDPGQRLRRFRDDEFGSTEPLAGLTSTRICRSPRRIAPRKHVPEKSGMRSGFAERCASKRGRRGQPVGWPNFNVYQPSGCPRAAIFQALSGTLLAHGHAQPGMCLGPHHASGEIVITLHIT